MDEILNYGLNRIPRALPWAVGFGPFGAGFGCRVWPPRGRDGTPKAYDSIAQRNTLGMDLYDGRITSDSMYLRNDLTT
jgi:hypothetical protein